MSTPNVERLDLAVRVEKLEKQNRRMKQVGTVALVMVAAVVLMGQAPGSRVIEANEFVLRNRNGEVGGRWSFGAGWPKLELLYGNGEPSLSLDVMPSGPRLALWDRNGDLDIHLGTFYLRNGTRNRAGLEIYGPEGIRDEDSYSGYSKPTWISLNVTAEGVLPSTGPTLLLQDKEGFQAEIGMTDLVTPRTGETHKTSAASVVLFDKDKNVIWQAP